MPTFDAPDGTTLAYHLEGDGAPLVCLPGGPMRASAHLGDLGGLSARWRLVLLDLRGTGASEVPEDPATYRCDRQVDDVEALRAHLGLETIGLLAHSAAGDLALLYAARYPRRVRSLTLVTARARALGVEFTPGRRREAAALRKGEPWYEEAYGSYEAIWSGTATDADFDAAAPFFHGRWDAASTRPPRRCAGAASPGRRSWRWHPARRADHAPGRARRLLRRRGDRSPGAGAREPRRPAAPAPRSPAPGGPAAPAPASPGARHPASPGARRPAPAGLPSRTSDLGRKDGLGPAAAPPG
ncbi:alpha/beta fold hydrolase [Streptomyces thermolilacinus]|uniref:alpha/beta fold hydrolase n=1 Tax=Streptomyces thermolilacinus TaxID=285540 RepID=UPI0003C77103|nr:alpha/beta fold hydrolase [Streptomyces thermolilacinus]